MDQLKIDETFATTNGLIQPTIFIKFEISYYLERKLFFIYLTLTDLLPERIE